jgi:hypothetical protein
LVLAPLFLSAARSYAAGAARGWGATAALGYADIGSYSLARVLGGETKAEIEMTDFVALEAILKDLGADIYNKFKRDARKVGIPARNDVRKAFQKVGPQGPLGPRKPNRNKKWATPERIARRTYDGFNTVNGDNGRLSWRLQFNTLNRASGIDVNYRTKNPNKDLSNLRLGRDGQIGVVRVRVRKAPFIIADMAGRGNSMYSQGRGVTKPYQINLFGRGVITRTHTINRDNSNDFVDNLMRAKAKGSSTASRYAYPAFLGHQPTFRANFDKLLQDTVNQMNRKLGN